MISYALASIAFFFLDLSQRVNSVREENGKLKSENEVNNTQYKNVYNCRLQLLGIEQVY